MLATLGLTTLGLATLPLGCGADRTPETARTLLDGSPAPALPAALARAGVRGRLSLLQLLRAEALPAGDRGCVSGFRTEFRLPPGTAVVRRVGTHTESLTFVDAAKRVVLGCDRTDADVQKWCGRSVGRLFGGRLRDPRVDIGCRTARAGRIAFGWLRPAPRTRWVVAGDGDDADVEIVAAGFPVRVSGARVDVDTSSASFSIVEYDVNGTEVRRYALRSSVSG
jgi:hypothetical protein